MKKAIIAIGSFILGAVTGAVPMFFIQKKKKEQAILEQANVFETEYKKLVELIKDADIIAAEDINEETISDSENEPDSNIKKYEGILSEKNIDYTQFSKKPMKEVEKEVAHKRAKDERPPKILSPEEYEELCGDEDYDICELSLFKDMYVVDEDTDTVINDVDTLLGDALEHFGEYYEDRVYVQNFQYKTIYSITKVDFFYEDQESEEEE